MCVHFLGNLVQTHGFKRHPYARDLQTYIYSLDLSPKLADFKHSSKLYLNVLDNLKFYMLKTNS